MRWQLQYENFPSLTKYDSMGEETQSQFSRMLASDPEMAARSLEVEKAVREAASEEVQAIERSERLTPADLAIVINARADNSLTGKE